MPATSRIAVVLTGPGTIGFLDESAEERPLKPREVRVQTLYSGISAGTELTYYRAANPYQFKRWDPEKRLFIKTAENEAGSYPYPVRNWGYEEVGVVVETGPEVTDLPVNSLVYGTWGHRSGSILEADYARDRQLPAGTDPLVGIFSHIGPVALNGILDSDIRLGETVAVFGLGVVGNLVAQLAILSGARVIGVDLLPDRLEKAREVGIETVPEEHARTAAEYIKELTGGRGADICIEASGNIMALHEAIRACAYNSRVVTLGFYQGSAAELFLGEEFHHNRIVLVCSQIGGLNASLQHRWNRLRLVQTFMDLAVKERVKVKPLITGVHPAWEAPQLFKEVASHPDKILLAVLDFQPDPPAGVELLKPDA